MTVNTEAVRERAILWLWVTNWESNWAVEVVRWEALSVRRSPPSLAEAALRSTSSGPAEQAVFAIQAKSQKSPPGGHSLRVPS
jgi:hypothetical protein